jgi:hypothetical protein
MTLSGWRNGLSKARDSSLNTPRAEPASRFLGSALYNASSPMIGLDALLIRKFDLFIRFSLRSLMSPLSSSVKAVSMLATSDSANRASTDIAPL